MTLVEPDYRVQNLLVYRLTVPDNTKKKRDKSPVLGSVWQKIEKKKQTDIILLRSDW